MKATDIPAKFSIPFANNAGTSYKRAIPEASQIPTNPGYASLYDGFPPLCFQPVASGGVPPFGEDFNGLFNQITAWNQWQNAGGPVAYDAVFSAAVGGYPKGTILAAANAGSFWLSTVDDNVTDPDSGGAGWIGYTPGGLYAADAGSANAAVITIPIAITTLSDLVGKMVRVKKIAAPNTAGMTLTVNTLTASLVYPDGTSIFPGDLPANCMFGVVFDGTRFQLQSASGSIISKAPLDSPTFLNTPKAPTPGSSDNSTRLATTAFAQTKYSAAVNYALVYGCKAFVNFSVSGSSVSVDSSLNLISLSRSGTGTYLPAFAIGGGGIYNVGHIQYQSNGSSWLYGYPAGYFTNGTSQTVQFRSPANTLTDPTAAGIVVF